MTWRKVAAFVANLPPSSAVARHEGWAWTPADDLLDLVRRTLGAVHLKDGDPGAHPASPTGRAQAERRAKSAADKERRLADARRRRDADEAARQHMADLAAAYEAQRG